MSLDDQPVIAFTEELPSGALTVLDLGKVSDALTFPIDSLVEGINILQLASSSPEALVGDGWATISPNYIGYKPERGFKLFDKKGRFISDFGRVGEGPEEFPFAAYCAQIDEKKGRVYLLGMGNASFISEYDLQGGFQRRIPLPYTVHKGKFFVDGDTLTVIDMKWVQEDTPAAWRQDFEGNKIDEWRSQATSVEPDFSNEIYAGRNAGGKGFNVYTFNVTNKIDSLYHFTPDGGFQPVLTVKPVEGKGIGYHSFTELPGYYIVTMFGREDQGSNYILNPNDLILLDKKSLRGCQVDFVIEELGGLGFKGYVHLLSTGYFVYCVEPGDLADLIDETISTNKNLTDEQIARMRGLTDGINMEGNNVIIYGKVKDK